jgi:hypothetical protein
MLSTFIAGTRLIDTGLLLNSDILKEAIHLKDFTSDRLVLRLCEKSSIESIWHNFLNDSDDDDPLSVVATCLYLFFLQIFLMSVNGDNIPPVDRIVYMWSALIFFYSLKGLPSVTKGNVAAAAFGHVFLFLNAKVKFHRGCTTEWLEHLFGNARSSNREFTTGWFTFFVDKLCRRIQDICKHDIRPPNGTKGYMASFEGFMNSIQRMLAAVEKKKNASAENELNLFESQMESGSYTGLHDIKYRKFKVQTNDLGVDVTVPVDKHAKSVAEQTAPELIPILNKASAAMRKLLALFGVTKFPSFAENMKDLNDLRDAYFRVCDSVCQRKLTQMGLGKRSSISREESKEELGDGAPTQKGGLGCSVSPGKLSTLLPHICSSLLLHVILYYIAL